MSEIIFPSPPTYQSPFGGESPFAPKNPLAKESLFHIPKIVNIGNTSSPIEEADIHCQFAYFASGFDLLERYDKVKSGDNYEFTTELDFEIGENSLIILYEDHTEVTRKSNLYGTACRVLLGEKVKKFIKNLIDGKKDFFFDNTLFGLGNLTKFVLEVVKNENDKNKNIKTKIDPVVVELAILLEYNKVKDKNPVEELFEGLTDLLRNELVSLIAKGSEGLESFKLTATNYEPGSKNYTPIIPIGLIKGSLKNIIDVGDNIGNFIVTVADLLGNIFPIFKDAAQQLKFLLDKLKSFAQKISDFIVHGFELANAFICGLCNGLISLVQSILLLLGFIVEKIPLNPIDQLAVKTIKNAAGKVSEYQIWSEFAEDTLETIIISIPEIFDRVVENINYIINNLEKTFGFVTDAIGKGYDITKKAVNKGLDYLAKKTPYWWAFIVGAIAFEIILDAILAFFTGGTSIIAQVSAKISRAATKAAQIATKVAKAGAQIATKAIDLTKVALKFIKNIFKEAIEALKNGKFIEWLKKKFDELFGINKKPKIPDIDRNALEVFSKRPKYNSNGEKLLTLKELRKLSKTLWNDYKVKIRYVNKEKVLKKKLEDWNRRNVQGSFNSYEKTMYLRSTVSELTAFHELSHLNHWKSLGDDVYRQLKPWQHETYVWDQVWKNKHRWTDQELIDSYKYINDTRNAEGIEAIIENEMEEILKKMKK